MPQRKGRKLAEFNTVRKTTLLVHCNSKNCIIVNLIRG